MIHLLLPLYLVHNKIFMQISRIYIVLLIFLYIVYVVIIV